MFLYSACLALVGLFLTQPARTAPVNSVMDRERALAKRTVSGPKLDGANFPDPSIVYVDNSWYAFATRTIGSSIHIQIATSTDFETWNIVYNTDGSQRDALPDIPSWAVQDNPDTWAPDINQLDDGSFVLYFAASTVSDTSKHCVGAATSSTILGPYVPQANVLFCPLSEGGAIDASGYNDNGQRYIVYKVDGNSIGHGGDCGNTVAPIVATPLILQPVSSDGVTLTGSATTLLDNNGASDSGIVEAPSLVGVDGTYVLFFSSGCFTTNGYTVSYATASSITGPYTRVSTPLLQTGDQGLTAPGSADVTKDGEKLVLHGNYGDGRAMYTDTITISGGVVDTGS